MMNAAPWFMVRGRRLGANIGARRHRLCCD
jgi:hypothetical protein